MKAVTKSVSKVNGKSTMNITPNEPKPSRMALSAVVKGKIAQPLRLVVYGPPGIGKSTFAADAPNPIFIGAEKGTAELDIARFPQPETWQDIFEAIHTLGTEQHDYRTLVLDTLDWIEPLCHRYVVESLSKREKEGINSIDDLPYGRGYQLALDKFRILLAHLDRLTEVKGMNIILLAHSNVRTFKNPEGPDFDRYEMKLHRLASNKIQEWADEVLFATYETETIKERGRVKGVDTGMRVLRTTRHAVFDAKNRHSLPDSLPLSWSDYESAVQLSRPAESSRLRAAIEELLVDVAKDTVVKVKAAVDAAGDNATQLTKILNRVKVITKKEE